MVAHVRYFARETLSIFTSSFSRVIIKCKSRDIWRAETRTLACFPRAVLTTRNSIPGYGVSTIIRVSFQIILKPCPSGTRIETLTDTTKIAV